MSLNERVNVVLSPSLYWVKKLELPVKRASDAQKLLPSIFEDTLGSGVYSYFVYKKDDYFYAFAYEDKVLLDLLLEKGVSSSNIANVYFAQSELEIEDSAYSIDKERSIYKKDDILIVVPTIWLENTQELDISELKLSKNSVNLAQYGHIVDKKSLYTLAAIVLAFIFLVLFEYVITTQKSSQISKAKEELFSKAKLQATMFQNRAILKKYKSTHAKQMQLRKFMGMLLSMNLKADESMKSISFKNKSLKVEFKNLSLSSIKVIEEKLKAKRVKFKSNTKEKIWKLEMSL